MEGPGRKSLESLSVVTSLPGQRLEPPVELSESQAGIWRSIVSTKPPDWWRADSAPLLVAYCKAIELYRALAAQLEAFTPQRIKSSKGFTRYEKLCKLTRAQAQLLTTLATKMRLSQQSRYTEKTGSTADRKAGGARPWEFTKAE